MGDHDRIIRQSAGSFAAMAAKTTTLTDLRPWSVVGQVPAPHGGLDIYPLRIEDAKHN